MKQPLRVLGLSVFLFLFALPVHASDLLELVLHHDAERRGDYDALAASWLEALPRLGNDFRVELLLRRLREIESNLRDRQAIVEPLAKALETGVLSGTARQVTIDLLQNAYRQAGRHGDAETLHKGRGFLQSLRLIGPFGKGKAGALRRVFPPEIEVDFAGRYRDRWQELAWRPLRARKTDPLVDPREHVYPRDGVVYFLSQVRSAEARHAVLHVGSRGPLKLWLDGAALIDESEGATFLSDRRAVGCQLEAGWNHILIKTADPFWIRISDSNGDPLPPGALVEANGELHERASDRRDPRWEGPYRASALGEWETLLRSGEPVDGDGRTAREEAGDSPPPRQGNSETKQEANKPASTATEGSRDGAVLSPALEHLGLGLLYGFYGRAELAVEQVERAVELAAEDPFVLHQAGEAFRSAAYLPPNVAKNRARTAWEKAVERDAGFLPAQVRLARLLDEDGKSGAAATRLQEISQSQPGFLLGLLELQLIFSQQKWDADERLVLRSIERVAPAHPLPLMREAYHAAARDNMPRAIELYREAFEHDQRRVDVLLAIGRLERRQGHLDKAEATLRRALAQESGDPEAEDELVDLLAASGRAEEAAEILAQRVTSRPWDPEAHRALGTARERTGQHSEALLAYRKALELSPGDLELRRYVQTLSGKDSEFWKPYDERLEDWLQQVPTSGPLVEKAGAICVIDLTVVKVYEDGSSSEYVHQAFKLLTEDGKKSLAEVQTPGEILLVRTVNPHGEVLEPVAAKGKTSFVMPGLEPGAYTEYAFRLDQVKREGAPLRKVSFYFQDFRFQQAYLLSRYVLLLPPGFDSGVVENGLDHRNPRAELAKVERRERDLEDGSRVITYEARNVTRLQPERAMPSRTEYLPNVEVIPAYSWEDVREALRKGVAGRTRPTPELRRAAADVAKDIEDPLGRARAIYDFVNELVPSRKGPGDATHVLLGKSGDRTALFKALVDLAGVPASWAFLRPREDLLQRTDWQYPRPEMFFSRAPLVVLEPPGKAPVWVSLEYRRMPFGRLGERFSGGRALVLTPQGHKLVSLPPIPPDDYAARSTGTLRLGSGVDVEVELEMVTTTETAFAQKDRFRTLTAFQKGFLSQTMARQLFPGAKVKQAVFAHIDEPDKPLKLSFSLVAPGMLKLSDEDHLLRAIPQLLQMVRTYGGSAERKHPCHLRAQRAVRDRLRVEPGEHFDLRRLPSNVVVAGKLATYSLSYSVEGEAIVVDREITMEPGRLEPEEFPAFLKLCEEIDAAERESITFRKS